MHICTLAVVTWALAQRPAHQPPRAHRLPPSKNQRSRAQRSAAWACSAPRHPSFACRSHPPTTPAPYHAGTTGCDREPRASGIMPGTTGCDREPHPAHDHAAHHAQSALRALVPRRHHEPSNHFCTTGVGTTEPAQRVFRMRKSSHPK